MQDAFGVFGNIAEIGVHHGKTLLLLCHALNAGERAYAIDTYGDPPGRNAEDLAALHSNLDRYGLGPEIVECHIGDSQALSADDMRALTGGPNVRLFSVDGDHRRDAVLHDLDLAAAVLGAGGIVLADDLFNPWYPTVTEAIYDFLKGDPGDLEPIAFAAANGPTETGAAKLFLARRGYAAKYKKGLKLLNQPDLKHCDPFAGFDDVPTFDFPNVPQKHPLEGETAMILAEITAAAD